MTFGEATNQIAKKHGLGTTLVTGHMAKYWTEAAELYASSKWDEACDEQRDRCAAQFINSPDVKVNQYSAREYCMNAPKPEFKP